MVLAGKEECSGNRRMKKGFRFLAPLILSGLLLSGCATQESDGDNIVLLEQEEEITYSLTVATVGDVTKTQKLKCVYTQMNDEEISFALDGKRISKVYVKEGDTVTKGQLLAELASGQRADEIRTLEYEIARNNLLLEHATENENYQISNKWVWYLFQTGMSESDKETLDEAIEGIQRNTRYSKEDCQDNIEMAQLKLDRLKAEEKASRVYAGMDGTVTKLKSNLVGSTSDKDTVIMTIIDSSECLFESDKTEFAPCFKPDTELDMNIVSGTGAGQYVLKPWKMEEWGDKLYFALAESSAEGAIEVGASGTASFISDSREQVLTVPVQAVHKANDQTYVYVLNAEDVREVRYVEIGLEGDTVAEVVSGLSEGEKVIIK